MARTKFGVAVHQYRYASAVALDQTWIGVDIDDVQCVAALAAVPACEFGAKSVTQRAIAPGQQGEV